MNKNVLINTQILLSLFLIFLLNACQQERAENPHLSRANALMEDYPDSALIILEGIQEPTKMQKADRALYALLLTQAHDKNYITHTNDSLIQIAVDYYKNGKDVYRKAQSLYYLGCVYEDMNNIVLSIEALLKAKDVLGKEYYNDRLIFLINSNLAIHYRSQGFYKKAIEVSRESYTNSINRKDSNDLFYPLDYIGSIFLFLNKEDSALYYYKNALSIAEALSDSLEISLFSGEISKAYYYIKEFDQANVFISKAIKFDHDNLNLSNYFTKGDILYKLNDKDSARRYLLKSVNSDDIYTRASSYLTLFQLERDEKNYKEALEYGNIFYSLSDSIYQLKHQTAVVKLLNEHDISTRTRDIALQQKKKIFITVIIFFLIVIVLTLIFMIIDKYRKKHIIELQKQLMRNKAQILKTENYNNDPDKIISLKKLCFESITTSKELFKKSSIYKQLYISDKLNKEIALPFQQRENLKEIIYETFPDALLVLRDLYNITSDDAYCCILYSLNFSNKTVAACMGVAEGAIKTRKSRIKSKVDEDLYSYIFSNN